MPRYASKLTTLSHLSIEDYFIILVKSFLIDMIDTFYIFDLYFISAY